jgi:SAM-dependent methyltransferase
MWKMYSRKAHSGSSSAFWDDRWDEGADFAVGAANDRICDNQGPIGRLMREHVDPNRLFLEGGCGPANFARYFHERGYKTVGLDFAERTVAKLRALTPDFDVRVGDVAAMPFADGSVHSYYSGGVVEHFESGPEPSLREARRVLAQDGWFFCSVPDSNVIRTQVAFRLNGDHPTREVSETRVEPAPDDLAFFQYTFKKQEFIARLEAAGFYVAEEFGYSVLWGVMEFPGVKWAVQTSTRALQAALRGRSAGTSSAPAATIASPMMNGHGAPQLTKNPVRRVLERLVLQEDITVPVLGPVLEKARDYVSNMRMYVARPR